MNPDCLQNATQDFNIFCRRASNFNHFAHLKTNQNIIEPSCETHHRTAAKDLVQSKTDCLRITKKQFQTYVYIYIHIKGILLSGMLWIFFSLISGLWSSLSNHPQLIYHLFKASDLKINLGTYTSSFGYWYGFTHNQVFLIKKSNMTNSNTGVPTKYSLLSQ